MPRPPSERRTANVPHRAAAGDACVAPTKAAATSLPETFDPVLHALPLARVLRDQVERLLLRGERLLPLTHREEARDAVGPELERRGERVDERRVDLLGVLGPLGRLVHAGE